MQCIKMQGLLFIFLLVCLNIGSSRTSTKEKTQLSDVENGDSNKSPTSSIPIDVESRFFDLGGVIKQLLPGFNQRGASGNPGLNLPSNSQFYSGGGVPAQNWNPLIPINQGNGWYPNQQNIARPLFQDQGTPPDSNFNQHGSINNINQPKQYLNHAGLGQYPANLNGNLINAGGNQRRRTGNLQNSGFQQGQGQGRPNYDPNAFEYPGRKPAHSNQGESNYNNNYPSYNEGSENCIANFNNIPQNQFPQSNPGQTLTNQNNNGLPLNQYPGQDYYQNGQVSEPNPENLNEMRPDQRSQNSNDWNPNYDQRQSNQNNMNQFPSGQENSANQGTPSDQFQQGANNRGQNNLNLPRGNVNNNLPPNKQGINLNNNNRPNQQNPQSQNNQNQGVQPNPGQASGNSNGTIRYPDDDDDDFGQTPSTPIATVTNIAPTTKSPTIGNAIVGKPVLIPTSTIPPGQVVFVDGDVTTASQKECVQNCPTSSEYNPVCGTDNVSYFNPGRMLCARNCGINVFESRKGNCNRNK